jgi:hypothetical protein
MAFAATFKAVELASKSNVFACHRTKTNTIVDGEYGFSRALLNANLNFDTLLLKYGNIDWRLKSNWNCNRNEHPTRKDKYRVNWRISMTVHPLETVFYKPLWVHERSLLSSAYVDETWAYLKWAVQRKRANQTALK